MLRIVSKTNIIVRSEGGVELACLSIFVESADVVVLVIFYLFSYLLCDRALTLNCDKDHTCACDSPLR